MRANMMNVTSPATAPRDRPPAGAIRVVVGVPHPMLRTAIAALIDSDPDLTLAGTTADVLGTARCLRAERPDVLLIQRRLALPAIGTIRELQSLSPGVAVLVVGMETDTAYETVSRAAGAVGFVALDAPAEELLAAVKHAPGAAALGESVRRSTEPAR
jgi:two-component system response regulator DesR